MPTTTLLIDEANETRIDVKLTRARGKTICTFHAVAYGDDQGATMTSGQWTQVAVSLAVKHRDECVDMLGLVRAQLHLVENGIGDLPSYIEISGHTLGNRRAWWVRWEAAADSDSWGRLFMRAVTSRPLMAVEWTAAFKVALPYLEARANEEHA